MTDQDAFDEWFAKRDVWPRITYDEVWHAALAWLRSQGEPVAWLNPYGGVLKQLSTGLERNTYTIPLFLAPQPAIPDGWQIVPKTPTTDQKQSGLSTCADTELDPSWEELTMVYRSMIAAAPEPRK